MVDEAAAIEGAGGVICEIINPSDAYTIDATDKAAACAATLILGCGKYGLRGEQGEDVMGIFLFGGHDEFWKKEFGGTVAEYLTAHKPEVRRALESVVIGTFSDRRFFFETIEALTQDQRQKWVEKWNDRKRSSMNDIGGRARNYAEALAG